MSSRFRAVLVRLTRAEMAVAEQAATLRWQLARASGVGNHRRDARSDADIDLIGAEMAVAKALRLTEFVNPEFREALLRVAGEGGAINGTRLGKWLSQHQNRVVAGHRSCWPNPRRSSQSPRWAESARSVHGTRRPARCAGSDGGSEGRKDQAAAQGRRRAPAKRG